MSDNSDSDDPAKCAAFNRIRAKIPHSPVLQGLCRKGKAKCLYRRNLNGIFGSDSDTGPERQRKKTVRKDRDSDIHSSSAKGYVSPSSKDVEYATEWC
jgi:hypothetical protein